MKLIHPAIYEQLEQRQPAWWVIMIWYVEVAFGTTFLFVVTNISLNITAFFLIQFFITATVVLFFLIRYKNSVFFKIQEFKIPVLRTVMVSGVLGFPLAVYHGSVSQFPLISLNESVRTIEDFSILLNSPTLPDTRKLEVKEVVDNEKQQLKLLHQTAWSSLAYGASKLGVLYNTLVSIIIAPVFEELIFSFFIFNILCNRFRFTVAVVATPLFFALLHIPAFGFGTHLIPIILGSFIAIIARLMTGTWLASVGLHLLFNLIIYMPKLMIAFYAMNYDVI